MSGHTYQTKWKLRQPGRSQAVINDMSDWLIKHCVTRGQTGIIIQPRNLLSVQLNIHSYIYCIYTHCNCNLCDMIYLFFLNIHCRINTGKVYCWYYGMLMEALLVSSICSHFTPELFSIHCTLPLSSTFSLSFIFTLSYVVLRETKEWVAPHWQIFISNKYFKKVFGFDLPISVPGVTVYPHDKIEVKWKGLRKHNLTYGPRIHVNWPSQNACKCANVTLC